MRILCALATVCATAALASCGSSDDGGSGSSPPGSPLSKAAPFVGDGSAGVDFVDWTAARKTLGGAATGERLVRVADLAPLYTRNPLQGPEVLGFGFDDLEWEARLEAGSPINLVGLPEDFDLGAVERALERCGYERAEIDGGALYSREQLESCDGQDDPAAQIPEPQLANVAVLGDERVLVAGSRAAAVRRTVESRGEGKDFESALDDLGSTLDGVVAGYVGTGKLGCSQFDPAAGSPGRLTPEIEEALKKRHGDLGEPYEVLLVGFVPKDDRFDGRVVLDFEDDGKAEDGLEARRKSFVDATSPITHEPLSADLELSSAKAEDDALVFELASREGPLELNGRVVKRDLPFAAC